MGADTIGILLDPEMLEKVPRRRTGYEKLAFYAKAAKAERKKVMFLALPGVDLEERTASGYTPAGDGYRRTRRSIPAVIHNRAMPFTKSQLRKLRLLRKRSVVFNPVTRYTKGKIYRLLRRDEQLRAALPETRTLTRSALVAMCAQYDALFIKPQSGSVGEGIIKVIRSSGGKWTLRRGSKRMTLSTSSLYRRLRRWAGGKPYLVQEAIPLATYRERPYDLRVSVQKDGDGEWQVTGMVGKVARKGKYVTNAAQGGAIKKVELLFRNSGFQPAGAVDRVSRMSLQVARSLEKQLPGIADLGLDVGITKDGRIMLIEVNGRDQRYTFGKAGLKDVWFQTYANPIKYASYLLTQSREDS